MRRRSGACAIASLGVALGAGPAMAGLTYDLRFSDGTKQKNLATDFTGQITLDLFARVTGTDGDHASDGLSDSYIVLQSSETGDLFDGALGSGTTISPFNSGRNGTAANLTIDGVGDWGATSSSIDDSHLMLVKSLLTTRGGAATGQAVDANTWEFRIATFALSVYAVHPVGNDETRIAVTRPTPNFPAITFAHYVQDNVALSVTNQQTAQQLAAVYGSYVSFVGSSGSNWDGGPGGAGSEWTTGANWSGDSAPASNAIATFGAGGTAPVIGINLGALAGNTATVGMIRLDTDANRNITVQNSSALAGTLSLSGVSGMVLDNQSAGRTLSLSGSGSGPLSIALPATAAINVSNSSSVINLSATIASSTLITKTGAGTLVIGSNQANWNGGLHIATGKVVIPANSSGVTRLSTLSVTPGATLDLNDNDLVLSSGDWATIQNLILEGYSAGLDTTKTGIISTTSQTVDSGTTILALFENSLAGFADYPVGSGQTIAANALVGKYTYMGDTNMDGQVTPQDYTAVDANLGTNGVALGIAWFYGDTNFDGDITPQDYTAVDSSLGLGVGNPRSAHAVPEPVVGVPLALLHWVWRHRRRRAK